MISRARLLRSGVGILLGTALLTGCQTTGPTAREEATERWNVARAAIKTRLASDQFEAGKLESAAQTLGEAYRLDPNNPELIPLQARIWLAQGNTTAAEELLEAQETGGTDEGEVAYLLGVVRQQQRRWHDALDLFIDAVGHDADEVDYVIAAAQTWLQLGQPNAALAFLEERAGRFGWTDAFQTMLAECHEQAGNWSAAASAWQRIMPSDGVDDATRERLAAALFRAARYSEAISTLESLLEDKVDPPARLRVMLAECLLAQGRYDAAQQQLQLVVQQNRKDPQALRLLARSYGLSHDYPAASRCVREALALAPENVLTLELAVALAWKANDISNARAYANRLLRIDPDNAIAHQILRRLEASVRPANP